MPSSTTARSKLSQRGATLRVSRPSVLTYHGDAGGGAMDSGLAELPDDFVAVVPDAAILR